MSTTDPFIAVIGGTGLESRLDPRFLETAETVAVDTPFGPPSTPIIVGRIGPTRVALLARHGIGHVLNPRTVPYRANIFALKSLGVTHVVASGACGSLREEIRPGDVVIADQLIDKTEGRPRTFFDGAAVHVEFAEPFCPVTRRWLLRAARAAGLNVHEGGTYVCMEGPAFSTRAESELHRQWGGDLIGMTALPEARLAREAELAYALVALPTDYDCWRPVPEDQPRESLLAEIIGNLNRATDVCVALLKAALSDVSPLAAEPSPAHDALRLGIWSDKKAIPRAEVERLGVLWGRYF